MAQRERHEPQQTVLYQAVEETLEEFLLAARDSSDGKGLPRFIEKTFRAYLDCGIPEAAGFARLHCKACGFDGVLAFSCKKRGICPSCLARMMADSAEHLVTHVLPHQAIRQWVISYPFRIRAPLAFRPDVLVAVERVVVDTLAGWQKRRGGDGAQAGGISVRHRFGSAVNINPHLHVLLVDGVYVKDTSGLLRFQATAPPTVKDLRELATRMNQRIHAVLLRRGLLAPNDDVNNEPVQLDALGSCTRAAMSVGMRERTGPALSVVDEDDVELPRGPLSVLVDGLSLYASTMIHANDREALEHVCRYLMRPAITLGRLKRRADGLLTYRMKRPDARGNTLLILSPMELMARLASLIPAPRHPQRRYFGILAPAAKDRAAVVPAPTHRKPCHARRDGEPAPRPYAKAIPWAELLKKIWGIDALACPHCAQPMEVLAVITDRDEATRLFAGIKAHRMATGPPVAA